MITYKIPDSIDFKVYKHKDNLKLVKITNKLTYTWFLVKDNDLYMKDRIVVSNKKTNKSLKRAIKSLVIGYQRTLILKGVGFKGWEDNQLVYIKVSSSKPNIYKLPSDINLTIDRNNLKFWSYNVTIIDNFIKRILLSLPAPKNSIIWK